MKPDQVYQAKWLELVKQYKLSNQTMKHFSEENNVKVYQLQYWLKKYQNIKPNQLTSFTEVNVIKQPTIIHNSIKLTSGKLVIEIPDNFNEGTLLKLLKVVNQVV